MGTSIFIRHIPAIQYSTFHTDNNNVAQCLFAIPSIHNDVRVLTVHVISAVRSLSYSFLSRISATESIIKFVEHKNSVLLVVVFSTLRGLPKARKLNQYSPVDYSQIM